jgi:DNA helicase II / ATP-dependent DNA helicase PcrA
MGVSAVPGSGKTHTLSYLAARLVAEGNLADDQEVLVVTLVNSAVDNFAARVAGFVAERGLLPHVGYRVRTLHALSHDIVRERPSLVGLADDFQIVDEREAERIIEDAAAAWLAAHPAVAEDFLSPDLEEHRREWARRDDRQWPALVTSIAKSFIKLAKDQEHSSEDVLNALAQHEEPLPLLEMGAAVYADYQRALAYRGALDFDDLIRLAIHALRTDPDYLARLHQRWKYILEDEAQDSSRLQEEILRLLAGPTGNWVRVGDPNQAIFETFTTASPQFLRNFLVEPGVTPRDLPNSGRSTRNIIELANQLVNWTQEQHLVEPVRGALTAPPLIWPTPPGDPQPNPPDDPAGVRLIGRSFTPDEELKAVADSLERWLPEHPSGTVAVLVPRNDRGFAVTRELDVRKIEYVELLKSTGATRAAAGALANILAYLAEPSSPAKLATIYRVVHRAERADDAGNAALERTAKLIRQCEHVEDFLWPAVERDGLTGIAVDDDPALAARLLAFREQVRRWQATSCLPIDQIILTLAQDLFDAPADLAIAHKLAMVLRAASRAHPDWRLPQLTEELALVAKNERKFLGFGDEDDAFDPDLHKGKVVVTTVHKAKGLEWDRVYLMSANTYDYPSALPGDEFIGEKWFVRGRLNLEAEALAQLKALFSEDVMAPYLDEGAATQQARLDYAKERLRLLYVGITRARRELVITWNTGRGGGHLQRPAAPFVALQTWLQNGSNGVSATTHAA